MGKIKKRKYGLAALCVCALCLDLSGCGAEPDEEEDIVQIEQQEESVYTMVVASVGDVGLTDMLRCTYRQTEDEDIVISADGKTVSKVYVSQGDSVVKGQLLAELKVNSDEEAIDELEYKIARNTLLLGYTDKDEAYALSNRWWSYVYQSSMSESETEKLEDSLESIRQTYRYKREDYQDTIALDVQQLENTRRELEESRIYAGMDGVLSYVAPDLEGAKVLEGQTVMTIIDTSRCLFEAKASDTDYADLFQEGKAEVLKVTGNGKTLYVEVIPYDMENWGETLYFELPEGNPDIQVGMVGTLIYVVDTREQVLTLPKRVIRNADGKNYVYVVGDSGIQEVRWIETGLWGDTLVEIVSGLEEGEYVIQK